MEEIQLHRGQQTWNLTENFYPDGTPNVDYFDALDSREREFSMTLRPRNLQQFITGMMICDSLRERGYPVTKLILPSIPGARQDRLNWVGDSLFTLKYVAGLINAQRFDRVLTIDPHSLVGPALIDRCIVVEQNFSNVFRTHNYAAVIAPDAGAAKRAFTVAGQIKTDFIQGEKHRDPATNKLSGFGAPGLEAGKHYLVLDDLCDAGGTFLGLQNVIADAGATADLYVTHGLFTAGTEKLTAAFRSVYTTDSTTFPSPNVKTINITEGLRYYA